MSASRVMAQPVEFEPQSSELGAGHEATRGFECDGCGKSFAGEPGGSGLFIWARGDEIRYEEPPLCQECADSVTVNALLGWECEEEEG